LHCDLSQEENVWDLDDRFCEDVDTVLHAMLTKRFETEEKPDGTSYTKDDIGRLVVNTKMELSEYLAPDGLREVERFQAKQMLAAYFWQSSAASRRYKTLAWCATRVHSMAVVTSKLERYFSHVGNVQTEKRTRLDTSRASLYAAAHQESVDARKESSNVEIQQRLINLVKRCEDIETEEDVVRFEDMDGFSDLNTWLNSIREAKLELLYAAEEQVLEPIRAPTDCTLLSTDDDSRDEDGEEAPRRRTSARAVRIPRRLNL
jgi:hypothetical protein